MADDKNPPRDDLAAKREQKAREKARHPSQPNPRP
jgi:hypothetical protein